MGERGQSREGWAGEGGDAFWRERTLAAGVAFLEGVFWAALEGVFALAGVALRLGAAFLEGV